MSIFSSTLSPSDPTPLEVGEIRSSGPAPWQLPSGGAANPEDAFKYDFETANEFRSQAISKGMSPQEADATYIAPLSVKWKALKSYPGILADPDQFLKFNAEFETARDNYSSQIRSGRSPKEAAMVSLSPTLEKLTLMPSLNAPKQTGDPKLLEAVKLADSGAPWEKILDTLGNDVNTAKLNLLEDRHKAATKSKDPEKPRSMSTIASDIKEWKRLMYSPNISADEKKVAQTAIRKLQEESMAPFRGAAEDIQSSDQPMDRTQMYSPSVIDDSWQRLPLPGVSKVDPGKTPLSPQEAAKYLERFKGDRKKAEEAARADGFSW